jgi:hypothetical protein
VVIFLKNGLAQNKSICLENSLILLILFSVPLTLNSLFCIMIKLLEYRFKKSPFEWCRKNKCKTCNPSYKIIFFGLPKFRPSIAKRPYKVENVSKRSMSSAVSSLGNYTWLCITQLTALQHVWGTYCLHLQPWKWRQYIPLKRWYLPTSPHGVTTQKNKADVFTAVKT